HNLAVLYHGQNRYREALNVSEEVLILRRKLVSKDDLRLINDIFDTADLCAVIGRYRAAEQFYLEGLRTPRQAMARAHALAEARGRMSLANLYRYLGRYSEAEPLARQAIAIQERLLGPDHPDLAAGITSLAQVYFVNGQFGRAERLFLRVMRLYEK